MNKLKFFKNKRLFSTNKMKEDYERNGFCIVNEIVPKEETKLLRNHVQKLIEKFDPEESKTKFSTNASEQISRDEYFLNSANNLSFFWEEDAVDKNGKPTKPKHLAINKIGHAMHEVDKVFERFSHLGCFKEIAKTIGYQQPVIVQSMYIFKQPNIGGKVDAHQDGTFLYSKPSTISGLWIALEDATVENGCLFGIKGSHLFEKEPSTRFILDQKDNSLSFQPNLFNFWDGKLDKMEPLEVKEGSVIVLHSNYVHMSSKNVSEKSRQAFTLHLMEESSIFDSKNWIQRSNSIPFPRL